MIPAGLQVSIQNSTMVVHIMLGAGTDSDNLLVARICTRLKKIINFQTGKPTWDIQKLQAERQKVQDTLEEKLCATECESGNVEVDRKQNSHGLHRK